MNLQSALTLIGPLVELLTEITWQIIESTQMNEEQKREALEQLKLDLDRTVQQVKNVKFDALSKGNQTP